MIIDFHTHIFPPDVIEKRRDLAARDPVFGLIYGDPKARMVTVEQLVEAMDADGVDKAVVCGFPWKDPGRGRMANEYLLDAAARYPDRILPFYTPPLAGGKRAVQGAVDGIAKGMHGIGEVAFYTTGMGKRQWSYLGMLAEAARAFEVPLLVHTNESVGHVYPGKTDMRLKDLWRFAVENQELTLVLGHWGGGLFFYELMKSVRKAMRDLRVYYDTAASPFLYAPAVYRLGVEIVGPERIVFGSDYPLIPVSRYKGEMEEAGLPGDVRMMILGRNACRLLGIPTR